MIEKIINIAKKDKKVLILIGVLIVCVAIVLLPVSKEKTKDTTNYEKLEKQLCDVLRQVNGVGKVSVMLTYEDEGTKVLASDIKVRTKESEIDSETKPVLQSGTPIIIRTIPPKIKGVIVVAEGANNSLVKENLKQAVISICGVMSHRVSILEMKK